MKHPCASGPFAAALVLVFAMGPGLVAVPAAHADPATDQARGHYETGLQLFYAREHAQALIEFQRAHEVKPRPATLFMMGQCEYFLGELRQAREHYQAYLRDSPTGEFVEVAKDRVESINRRPATLVINTVPDHVSVRITPAPVVASATSESVPSPPAVAQVPAIEGEAPNNFAVPRGRWLVVVSKPTYRSERLVVELDVAETKPLFFKLDPIPARLEIDTLPSGATLYVNGNRARNPYRQEVPPGRYEIFGEATNYENRAQDLVLGPGDRRSFTGSNAFRLNYVQRSGRPELIFTSAVLGGLIGAGAIASTVFAASVSSPSPEEVAVVGLSVGGMVAGGIGGALLANRFVPTYIPDNRALFMIGAMWIGVAEGALLGMSIGEARKPVIVIDSGTYERPASASTKLGYAFYGSLPGLALGATVGALGMKKAPTYGRVALIQSAAVGGAVAGALGAVALRWNPYGWQKTVQGTTGTELEGVAEYSIMDLSLPALIGLNVGVAVGLLGAYLPDQSRYGPSWKRIALIDLATAAGAVAGGVGACVADNIGCLTTDPNSGARARTAAIALVGGVAGFAAGVFLTRNVDVESPPASDTTRSSPSVAIVPMPPTSTGGSPMLTAVGSF